MDCTSSPRLILVLGIYRSGTSALTKGVEVLGVPLVDISATFCDEFNEKGYWEDLEIHQLNVQLLTAVTSLEERRRNILPLTKKEVDFLCKEGYLAQAIALLQKKTNLTKSLALKDPKFSITLPFWKKAFEVCHLTPSYVIALRHPQSVVDSMVASKTLFGDEETEKLWWLWISYLLSILQHTEGCSRIIVAYEELLKDPPHQIGRLANALKLPIERDYLKIYQNEFLDSSLLHFPSPEQPIPSSSFGEQFAYQIYQALLRVAHDQASFSSLLPLLTQWNQIFTSVQSLLMLTEKNEYLFYQSQQTIKKRDDSIKDLNKIIREKLNEIAQLCQMTHRQNFS